MADETKFFANIVPIITKTTTPTGPIINNIID